jgi:hypothetical protein
MGAVQRICDRGSSLVDVEDLVGTEMYTLMCPFTAVTFLQVYRWKPRAEHHFIHYAALQSTYQ